jgi:hypothetical protein
VRLHHNDNSRRCSSATKFDGYIHFTRKVDRQDLVALYLPSWCLSAVAQLEASGAGIVSLDPYIPHKAWTVQVVARRLSKEPFKAKDTYT